MKRILCLTALIMLFIAISSTMAHAKESIHENGEITLTTVEDETRHIKPERDIEPGELVPTPRSIVLQPVYAYLYNKVVSLDFTEAFSVVNVVITNQSTGETIHSETYSNPATLCVDLNGESGSNYLIEIEADDTFLTGNFSL